MENTSVSKPPKVITLEGKTSFEMFYEDTDFSGFVYHANYLKFFERARERLIGLEYLRDLHQIGVHFVVSKLDMRYLAPARHADVVTIESTVTASRAPTHVYHQRALVGEKLCVDANITIACLNKLNRPTRLPADVLNFFAARQAQIS